MGLLINPQDLKTLIESWAIRKKNMCINWFLNNIYIILLYLLTVSRWFHFHRHKTRLSLTDQAGRLYSRHLNPDRYRKLLPGGGGDTGPLIAPHPNFFSIGIIFWKTEILKFRRGCIKENFRRSKHPRRLILRCTFLPVKLHRKRDAVCFSLE